MQKSRRFAGTVLILAALSAWGILAAQEAGRKPGSQALTLAAYPQTLAVPPEVSSPWRSPDGRELVTARTQDGKWALVDVTVPDWNREEVKYFGRHVLAVDKADFPGLAGSGLHSQQDLARLRSINGRPLSEIDELARPGRLSTAGFLAGDETLLAVLKGDDRLARKLGLTHPQLARPLLQLWNLILQEQKHRLGEWGKGHAWRHFDHFLYNGKKISYEAHFTKGGQLSPFADGIEGAAHVFLKRQMEPGEADFLKARYARLGKDGIEKLAGLLSTLTTGELQPFFIVRYGFYEGHTMWRVDPVAIASIFGLRTLHELEAAFPGRLDEALAAHFIQ
jgi:hypothetical protein